MIQERPRALLFDWDNTLVDSWAAIHHALATTFRAMGQTPWTRDETQARVRASARDSFPRLFGDRAGEATEIFYRTFEADHLAQLREREGAGALVQDLAEAGAYYLAVVSNKQGRLLRAEAAHLGWTRFFDRLVGATDAARDKPAIEAVACALEGSGIEPGPEVWFVGDTDIDMLCAVNAGCRPVLIRADPPAADEFPDSPPALHLPDCRALLRTLKGL